MITVLRNGSGIMVTNMIGGGSYGHIYRFTEVLDARVERQHLVEIEKLEHDSYRSGRIQKDGSILWEIKGREYIDICASCLFYWQGNNPPCHKMIYGHPRKCKKFGEYERRI